MMTSSKKLTKRQQEILDLVLQGKQNKEISLELGISINTIEKHLTHIHKIENVSGRVDLIRKYLINGGNP